MYFRSEDNLYAYVDSYEQYLLEFLEQMPLESQKKKYKELRVMFMWFVFAFMSAVFAALTSILAKVGINGAVKINIIKTTVFVILSKNNIYLNFISFNYTTVFEEIMRNAINYNAVSGNISAYSKNYDINLENTIHIHGKLSQDWVLGVDNLEQFSNIPFPLGCTC